MSQSHGAFRLPAWYLVSEAEERLSPGQSPAAEEGREAELRAGGGPVSHQETLTGEEGKARVRRGEAGSRSGNVGSNLQPWFSWIRRASRHQLGGRRGLWCVSSAPSSRGPARSFPAEGFW